MRIVVCVKHVPDADLDRELHQGRIVRGEGDVLNELDEYAVEEAVSLVEEHGGEVIALTMGPEGSKESVLRALQMGADRGIVVCDPALGGADAPVTANVLATAIQFVGQSGSVDAVFTGMASLDAMTSMLPSAVSKVLDWPLLDLAQTVTVEGDGPWNVCVTRNADGWEETLSATTPVVVSVTDQINDPRFPNFKTMRAARQKPIDQYCLEDLGTNGTQVTGNDFFQSSTVVVEAKEMIRSEGVIVGGDENGSKKLAEFLEPFLCQAGDVK